MDKGRAGECYILSNRHYEVKDVLRIAKKVQGGRKLPVLPMWMARAAAPMLEWVAKRRRERPLYTKYSLYTLASNDRFSHDKATRELGYQPRDLYQTIRDTIAWQAPGPRRLNKSPPPPFFGGGFFIPFFPRALLTKSVSCCIICKVIYFTLDGWERSRAVWRKTWRYPCCLIFTAIC
mgnify:CR=1 FL=1